MFRACILVDFLETLNYIVPTMGGERVETTAPAIDRLRQLFFPDETKSGKPLATVRKLNDRERIWVEYFSSEGSYRQLMNCKVIRGSQTIMEFHIGKDGLEHLGLRKITLSSSGGSDQIAAIEMREGAGIGYVGGLMIFSVEEGEWEKFQALGDKLADWAESVTRNGRIMALPLQLASEV